MSLHKNEEIGDSFLGGRGKATSGVFWFSLAIIRWADKASLGAAPPLHKGPFKQLHLPSNPRQLQQGESPGLKVIREGSNLPTRVVQTGSSGCLDRLEQQMGSMPQRSSCPQSGQLLPSSDHAESTASGCSPLHISGHSCSMQEQHLGCHETAAMESQRIVRA